MKPVKGLIVLCATSLLLAMGAGFALLYTPTAPSASTAAAVEEAPAAEVDSATSEAEAAVEVDRAPASVADPTREEPGPTDAAAAAGPPAPAPKPDPLGYDEAPEQALAADLGLTPEQAEAVGQVLRECNAELDREMLVLMERGYDDGVAQQIGKRHEARVVKRVEAVLPAEVRPRFRELVAD